jgi:translation initiation factor 1A
MAKSGAGKGGKTRRRGKNINDNNKRELILKNPALNQEYAKVDELLGNSRLRLSLFDGTIKLGIIPGAYRKRVWFNKNDVILISIRDYQKDDKVDVVHKYNPDEVRSLVKKNEIPQDVEKKMEDKSSGVSIQFVSNEASEKEKAIAQEKKKELRLANAKNRKDYLGDDMMPSDSDDSSSSEEKPNVPISIDDL